MLLGMIGQIKVSGDRFRCVFVVFLYIAKVFSLGDRFREHLRDVEKDDKNASKPVARNFNLPNHSKQHMVVRSVILGVF